MSGIMNPWSPDGFGRTAAYYYSGDGIDLWYDDSNEEDEDA